MKLVISFVFYCICNHSKCYFLRTNGSIFITFLHNESLNNNLTESVKKQQKFLTSDSFCLIASQIVILYAFLSHFATNFINFDTLSVILFIYFFFLGFRKVGFPLIQYLTYWMYEETLLNFVISSVGTMASFFIFFQDLGSGVSPNLVSNILNVRGDIVEFCYIICDDGFVLHFIQMGRL